MCGYLAERVAARQARSRADLPEQTLREREQWRAARPCRREPEGERGGPDLLAACAADGQVVRGAVRADGTQVNLLSVMGTEHGTVLAQREIGCKSNEIPEPAPAVGHLH